MEGKVCSIGGHKTIAVNRALTGDEVFILTVGLDRIIDGYSKFESAKEEIRQMENLKRYLQWDWTEKDLDDLVSMVRRGTFRYRKYLKGVGKWRNFNIAVEESDKGYTVFSPYGESFEYAIIKDRKTGRVALETRYQEGENRKRFDFESL